MRQSTRAHAWDQLGFHLREFAESIELGDFQALSSGLGIGELRPVDHPKAAVRTNHYQAMGEPREPLTSQTHTTAKPERNMASATTPAMSPSMNSTMNSTMSSTMMPGARMGVGVASQASSQAASESMPKKVGGRLGRMFHRLYAWSIDMSLVVISMALAMVCAAAALTVGEGQEEFWYEGGPLAWLLKFEIWELGSIVLGVFLMYLLVFRLVAGNPFGESLTSGLGKKSRPAVKKSSRKAPVISGY
jgi:hypothetical protein